MSIHHKHRYRKYNVHETHTGIMWKTGVVFLSGIFLFGLGLNSLLSRGDAYEALFYFLAGIAFMFPLILKIYKMSFLG